MYIIKINSCYRVEWIKDKEKIKYNPKASQLFEVEDIPITPSGYVLCFNPNSLDFYFKEENVLKQEETLKRLNQIKKDGLKWLSDNDWKVNKRYLGEWSADDPRWLSYLQNRKIIREEIDSADNKISEIKGVNNGN